MQMILQEGKKLLIYQKIFLWLILFISLKLCGVFYVANSSEPDLPEKFHVYFRILGGQITETKKQYIERKYQDLFAIPMEINNLEDDYQNGKIAYDKYLDKLAKYSKIKQEEACIKWFYNKFQYASQDKDRRYIVQDDAWIELLTKEHMDWLLVVFLFVMTVPVFYDEYNSEMQMIQICSMRKGDVLIAKIVLVIGFALLMTLIFNIMEYYVYTIYMGGEYPYAPIQSLEFFEESSLPFSFFQMWELQTVCKMFGAVLLVLVIMAVSIMVKRSLLTIIGSALTIIIPVTVSDSSKLKYLLPFPAGLFYAVGYFYPDLYDYQLSNEIDVVEKTVSFAAFERKELVGIGGTFGLLLILLIIIIIIRYHNKSLWNIDFMRHNMKNRGGINVILFIFIKIGVIMLLLFSVLGLSGCGAKDVDIKESFYENSCNANEQTNTRYYFSVEENNILVYNLKTKEETCLFRDVFLQQENIEDCTLSVYTTEDYLYYGKDFNNEIHIYRVNLSDFSSECIYQKEYNFLDADYCLMLVTAHAYFVNDAINQECYCIDRGNGNWRKINTVGGLYATDYGNVVFYENMDSHIVSYDVITGKETIYPDIFLRSQFSVKSSIFYIFGDFCFYTNMLADDNIFCYQFSTGNNEFFISKEEINSFWCDDTFFYYIESNGRLMEINIKSRERRVLCGRVKNKVERSMNGEHFYQVNLKGEWGIIK